MSRVAGEVIYVQQHEDEEKCGVTLSAKTPVFSLKNREKHLTDGLSFEVINNNFIFPY